MTWLQTFTIILSMIGLWRSFSNSIREDMNGIREDMRENARRHDAAIKRHDAELKESRELWATLLQKIHDTNEEFREEMRNTDKKSHAVERQILELNKKMYKLELEKFS